MYDRLYRNRYVCGVEKKKKSCLCVNWESNPELNLTRGVEGLNVTATPLTLVVEGLDTIFFYIEHK